MLQVQDEEKLELCHVRVSDIKMQDFPSFEECPTNKEILQLTGGRSMACVHQLCLSKRRLGSSTALAEICSKMPNMQHLSIAHNLLSSVVSLISLEQLRTLDLDHNALTTLEGIESLQHLLYVYASGNRLRSLVPLQLCTRLSRVHVYSNCLTSLDEVMWVFKHLPGLQDLGLERNGCSSDSRSVQLHVLHACHISLEQFTPYKVLEIHQHSAA